MRLTLKGEYGLLALLHLAKSSNFIKIETIASQYNIPPKYLENLLTSLVKAGLVQTKRGPLGGYKLAKEPGSISIAEIIRRMDGKLAATNSASIYYYAPTPICHEPKLLNEFKSIRDFIANRLENLSLAHFI